ncbi:DHHC palmitoyltransferase-domain-containing protein [Phascolomyces articulosus]|uniref:Palmitoyltransferase n=1 Tax=Phascolomyces articulosus TaxID=60185 RepID=A0AAD5KGC1_9FUNG|nr:DHHC palmitoyltransferase-domain-containing protein [Phascolomyces articulosus]
MTWQEIKGQVIVGIVALLTTFVAYTSQIFVLWNFLGGATLKTLLILIPFNVFVIMIYVNYSLVCITDPGTVPGNWMPDPKDIFIEVKRSTYAPRHCKTCNGYKPPRTHHCSTCGRCVLKMDHHCPWINNCVGFSNYGHFIRFIVYVEISSIYLFTLLSCRLAQIIRDMNSYNVHPSNTEAAFLSINLILAAAAIVTVGILSGYHVYCLTTNTTTIEGWEKGTALTFKTQSNKMISSVKYPYNLGLYQNICAVLGSQPILWFWPQRMRGDGLHFPVRKYDGTWEEIIDDEEEVEDGHEDVEEYYEEDDDQEEIMDNGEDDEEQQRRHHRHCGGGRHTNNNYRNNGIHRSNSIRSRYEEDEEQAIGRHSSRRGRQKQRDRHSKNNNNNTMEEECGTLVINAPPRVHTRASTSSFNPTTPASVMTFASSSTLVDPNAKFPTSCTSKETYEMTHR